MATLATPPFVPPVNRIAGLLPPPGKQIGRPLQTQPAPDLVQTPLDEPGLEAILGWPLVLLALLTPVLWPVLFVAAVLLFVVLIPFVVGFKVLASFRRGGRAAG